jgi:prepilin-type N-terminal cleavage/methylation domain-containing protein
MNSRYNGFTLIELLVVISIISLLSSVVLSSLSGKRESAHIATIKRQVNAMKQAALQYQIENGQWAPDAYWDATPVFVPEYIAKWPDGPRCIEYDYNYHTYFGDSEPDVGISVHKDVGGKEPIARSCLTEKCWPGPNSNTEKVSDLNSFSCN